MNTYELFEYLKFQRLLNPKMDILIEDKRGARFLISETDSLQIFKVQRAASSWYESFKSFSGRSNLSYFPEVMFPVELRSHE